VKLAKLQMIALLPDRPHLSSDRLVAWYSSFIYWHPLGDQYKATSLLVQYMATSRGVQCMTHCRRIAFFLNQHPDIIVSSIGRAIQASLNGFSCHLSVFVSPVKSSHYYNVPLSLKHSCLCFYWLLITVTS